MICSKQRKLRKMSLFSCASLSPPPPCKVFSHKNVASSLQPVVIVERVTTCTCTPMVLQVLVQKLGKMF